MVGTMSEVDTRQRILDVAGAMFVDRGYDATSLREIAAELGFTKAALYYHFKSKEDILRELLVPFDSVGDEVGARLAAAHSLEAWAETLEWMVAQVPEHLELYRLIARNRGVIETLREAARRDGHWDDLLDIDAVVARQPDVGDRVRMVAALAAIFGFDDIAPNLLSSIPPNVLVEHLTGVVRDILRLPRSALS